MSRKVYVDARICYREDTLENWQTNNPVLERGEPSVVRDPAKEGEWFKVGDGVTAWNNLPWKKPDGADQTYNPESANAQSGKAVAEALGTITPNDFEVVAEGELTEAVNSILITTDKDGNALNLQDIISFYFYSPKAEINNSVTIAINNKFLTQVPTMITTGENYSKAISIYTGGNWETFMADGGLASISSVRIRNNNPLSVQNTAGYNKVKTIKLYCYNSTNVFPVGFKYKVYGRRAK